MNTFPDGICPLCSQIYMRERLHAHIAREHERVRDKTIQVIRGYHENWRAEHGACEPCWKSFREAARVLSLLKETKRQPLGHGWQRPDPTSRELDIIGAERRS